MESKARKHEPDSILWFPPERSYSERSEAITSRGWDSPPPQSDLVGQI